ncbi:(R)-mandelonitrile lyase [Clostridium thermobutyricum]|uniref:Cupin domain protein n=1 Tax=Clostridium thermobutyricum DSM 4928 TaxID=1121339 RepID=A0A1V4SUH9_9CLOT|nr:cupin domain-containing protein [Clostridium thermobutyricum]OPX47562.1 cupin domain protein [Clostridium thermobutyricum DSM 4928]
MSNKDLSNSTIFEKGEKMPDIYDKYFTGQAWLNMLVMPGESHNCPIGNVTFEPGCRNNWHKHPGGQILLVTEGRGWYQEEGKEARELHEGDVVKIPKNVKHWHGAAKDSWFVHLSVETNVAEGPAVWLEPVSDEDYNKLK